MQKTKRENPSVKSTPGILLLLSNASATATANANARLRGDLRGDDARWSKGRRVRLKNAHAKVRFANSAATRGSSLDIADHFKGWRSKAAGLGADANGASWQLLSANGGGDESGDGGVHGVDSGESPPRRGEREGGPVVPAGGDGAAEMRMRRRLWTDSLGSLNNGDLDRMDLGGGDIDGGGAGNFSASSRGALHPRQASRRSLPPAGPAAPFSLAAFNGSLVHDWAVYGCGLELFDALTRRLGV